MSTEVDVQYRVFNVEPLDYTWIFNGKSTDSNKADQSSSLKDGDGSIVADDIARSESIVQKFSEESTYEAGSYVMYNGRLYKCTTAHTGVWSDDDFTVTDVIYVLSTKADKVSPVTSGNLAGLDATGNLTDSGKKADDFALVSSLATKPNFSDLPNTNEEIVHDVVSILPGGTGTLAITPGVLAYPVALYSGSSAQYTITTTWDACTNANSRSAWRAELWVQCITAAPSITWGDSTWEWLDGSAPDTTDATIGTVLQVALRRLPSGKIQANLYNVYEKSLEEMYPCFTAETAGATVGMEAFGDAPSVSLETSTDGSTWNAFTVGSTIIQLSAVGNKVYFRAGSGGNSAFATSTDNYNKFVMNDGQVSASGNVNGLLDASGILTSGLSDYCFCGLFNDCYGLTAAPALPATTLSEGCYYNMFANCPGLATAPALPATTLATHCYSGMFSGCLNLTTAPVLPATTLAYGCYEGMFYGCTGLDTAPALPATTLAAGCYNNMFANCPGLTTAPALPATTLAAGCYTYMFDSCSGLTAATALPATTLADYCYNYMFNGCTGLTTAPALPATTLAAGCYDNMFSGCTGLTTAPALQATTLADYCYNNMFNGCAGLTTAPALQATTLADYCYNNMFNGCTSLASAPAIPATTLATYCYSGMFSGCTGLTTAPALPATTLAAGCYNNMFSGCTGLTTAPALPATTLADSCYYYMFSSCESLTDVTVSFISFADSAYTESWLDGVSSTGTFHCPNDLGTDDTISRGPSACPEGWTVYPTD